MLKGIVCGITLTFLLVGVPALTFNVQLVGASGTIYIRDDGRVDPPDAAISSVDNVTYTFTDNINGSIVVERDNVVVDGAGYALKGEGGGIGIDLRGRSNVTVRNTEIVAFYYGIYFQNSFNNSLLNNTLMANKDYAVEFDFSSVVPTPHSSHNNIVGNSIVNNEGGIDLSPHSSHSNVSYNRISANNWTGISLYASENNILYGNNVTANKFCGIWITGSSSNTTLRNNKIADNKYNLKVGAWSLEFFMNDIDVSNTVDGKPVYYWINKHGATVPLDAGYVALINCSNITVENLNLTSNGEGILLAHTENCTITQNNIANNKDGIYLTESSNSNNISYNNIIDNPDHNIYIGSSSINISVCHNNITNNGVSLSHVSGSSISFNNVTNGRIDLTASSINVICYNNITNGGVTLVFSSNNNSICHNNITSNFEGISLSYSSSSNVIHCNNIAANYCGIGFSYSSNNNTISHNNIKNSRVGFDLSRSSYNTVSHNNIANNERAVDLSFWCSSNVFHHNNFVNNTFSADIWRSGANIWDDGYPSGGNYWSDHNPPDEDRDRIGDTPYTIDANNVDRYPLIYPYGFVPNPDINDDGTVNIVDITTVARAFRCKPGDPNWDPMVDMDTNETINIIDVTKVAVHFGETTP